MIFPKLKVLRSHGTQYIPDLERVELTEEFRGRPGTDRNRGPRRPGARAARRLPRGGR